MKEYIVNINGLEHTMLLEEEDQKRRFPKAKATGNKEAEVVPEHPYQAAADAAKKAAEAKATDDKSETEAKATDDKSETEAKEADKPANKSGTAANK